MNQATASARAETHRRSPAPRSTRPWCSTPRPHGQLRELAGNRTSSRRGSTRPGGRRCGLHQVTDLTYQTFRGHERHHHGSRLASPRRDVASPTEEAAGADLRHHQPPRRRQDHPHREVPPLRRRGAGGRRGQGPGRAPPGALGLDGDGAEAGHLDHLDGAAVPVPRPRASTCSTPPGHRDFSEDTYRVLAAADAAIMVLDAAKGIEPQTRKLFEVCRERGVPLLTFINKWDRPGRPPLELLDEIESQLRLDADAGHLAGGLGRVVRRPGRPARPAPTPGSPGWPGARARPARSSSTSTALIAEGRDGATAARGARAARRRRAGPRRRRLPGRASRRRCSSARRSPTSACASCSTPCVDLAPSPSPRTGGGRHRAAARRPVLGASCSRSRPTWTRPTATGSPSCGSARAASSGAWWSPTARPASRSPPSTPTRCSARSARPSTRPSPAT